MDDDDDDGVGTEVERVKEHFSEWDPFLLVWKEERESEKEGFREVQVSLFWWYKWRGGLKYPHEEKLQGLGIPLESECGVLLRPHVRGEMSNDSKRIEVKTRDR